MPSIDAIATALKAEFGLTPIVGGEIECYVMLPDESSEQMDTFWVPVEKAFREEALPILRIEKERGWNQYEIVTTITHAQALADCLSRVRTIIEHHAAVAHIEVSFAAKPFADQPSSGIHIHLHLADDEGINAYHKTEEWTSDILRHSLGGLLNSLIQDMPIFFPNEADYVRLTDIDHVPKILGWGVNNRYCALRIPADPDPYHKRIEHRVPCANANPEAVIAAILNGVLTGLRQHIEPPAQEYGKQTAVNLQQALAAASAG